MPEEVRTLFTVCDACRYFAGQALLMASRSSDTHKIFITNGQYYTVMLD